ncbi:MAG: ComF family protein [Acidobacteriota bacterium]|nr:ComF family protein [Acidobacteriota bacterium]
MQPVTQSLFATFFPSGCRLCNAPLTNLSRLPVCESCLAGMHPIEGAVCAVCGERLMSPYLVDSDVASSVPSDALCGLCRRVTPSYARAVAYGSYDGGLRELIHLLKYQSVRPAADVLGEMLAAAIAKLSTNFEQKTILVVPVPLHRSKLRERGFNQSELIARAALKFLHADGRLRVSPVLKRIRPTKSQIGLTQHQRRENLRGAFAVINPEEIKGSEILLVDDVVTTGTTVSECARILRRAGASNVWVASVGRTLKLGQQSIAWAQAPKAALAFGT